MLLNHVRINRIYARRHPPRSWALANVTVVMATCQPRASAGPGPGDTAVNKAGPDPEVARRVQGSKRWDHEGKELMRKCSVRAWVPSLVGRGGDRGKRQVPVAAESNMRLEGELEINQTKQEEIGGVRVCVCVSMCVCVYANFHLEEAYTYTKPWKIKKSAWHSPLVDS